MSNLPSVSDILALVDALKAIDLQNTAPAELVPLVKAVQSVGAYAAAVDAEIQRRAIGNGEMLPGVVVKDAVTHRKWNDADTAADLAFSQFGLKAFKLESPAAIEKLGDEGKALVAVASFKPEAGKRVVY
ncbi:MAG: hypothetical protein AAGL98_00150 [Planctomycetota bacterium]